MRKSVLSLLVALGFVLTLVPSSYAVTLPLFGPKKYQRTTGKPDVYSDTVEACNTGASYKIVVENGEAGTNRVSSGTITLNGTEIVTQNEFKQQVGKIEKPVSLNNENTVEVKLSSIPGSFINVSLVCTANCLDVKISSPSNQSSVNKSSVIVKGDLYNAFDETGVTVKNTVQSGEALSLAQRSGAIFAGITPLQTGVNTLTATATDACGQKAVDTVKVNTTPIEERLRLSVLPASGVLSPAGSFQATFEADASLPNTVASYSWDFNGDGISDQTGKDLSKVTNNYTTTGLYFPQVTVTDTAGNTYTETAIVNVLSREEMDKMLKGKWEGVRGELASGNVKKALRYISERSQKMYQYNFELMSTQLPNIANDMGKITLVNITGDTAEYDLTATQDGKTRSFYVQFVRDRDGIWRIKFY